MRKAGSRVRQNSGRIDLYLVLLKYVAEYLNADLYEIKAEPPYSSEDLDHNTSNSRANKEQNDSSARPAILGKVENMERYHTVVENVGIQKHRNKGVDTMENRRNAWE
jgi:hypothetical protein